MATFRRKQRIAQEMEDEIIDELVDLVQREVAFTDEVELDQRDYAEIAERSNRTHLGGCL